MGLVAHRIGGYLTKKGRHRESINHLLQALEAGLISGNYEMMQASCGNIGSVIHRLGRTHYAEARLWLLLGIAIARWMKIGRDDAHGEMILGKIYIEQGKAQKAYWLLKRAERIAERTGNQVNLGDVRMVWGFWHQGFGKQNDERDTYHYGPYSFDLSHELSSLDSLGVLNIQSDSSGYGFDISVGKFAERFKLEPKYQKKIDKVVSDFGSNTPAQLEVKATIHFVLSVVKKKTPPSKTRPEVVQKVHALKPRFTEDFIRRCYSDLKQANWI